MDDTSFLVPQKSVAALGLGPGMKVADFGAAAGFFTRAAARKVAPGGVVWAVDSNREILSRIKNVATAEGLHNVEVVHGNVEKLGGTSLPDNMFDAVILANILFTLESREECVREVARVLKPGGHALVIDWKDSFGGLGPHPNHVVDEEVIQNIFLHHGFRFAGSVRAGAYHWGFVVRKKPQSSTQ